MLANNSLIDINKVVISDTNCYQGDDSNRDSLDCHTDRRETNNEGINAIWFFTDGNIDFCDDDSNNLMSSLGKLCCTVTDISDVNQTVCVNYG